MCSGFSRTTACSLSRLSSSALDDEDPGVRVKAAGLLGSLGVAARPAIPMLKQMLAGPAPEVRRGAEAALATLEPEGGSE